MKIKSKMKTTSVRRVVIELPEERAKALAEAINEIHWSATDVEKELARLYGGLSGYGA